MNPPTSIVDSRCILSDNHTDTTNSSSIRLLSVSHRSLFSLVQVSFEGLIGLFCLTYKTLFRVTRDACVPPRLTRLFHLSFEVHRVSFL